MQFIKQGKQTRSWWREKRLADEVEERLTANLSRYALSSVMSIFAVATLVLQGFMIALPFIVLAAFIYIRK